MGEEISSYAQSLELDSVPIDEKVLQDYDATLQRIQQEPDYWTSISVLIVNTSGSMKASDVWGGQVELHQLDDMTKALSTRMKNWRKQ